MYLAIMLVCSPLNLIHYDKECFGVEDTTIPFFELFTTPKIFPRKSFGRTECSPKGDEFKIAQGFKISLRN